METTGNSLETPATKTWRGQLIAISVLIAVAAIAFFWIQNVNSNHSYGQAKTVCRELMEERTVGLNTISWTVNTGGMPDNVKEDDGNYLVEVVVSDMWGNEETRSCVAFYQSGNWDTYII